MNPRILWALLAGSLFAVGLVLSGMTQPAKVMAFLDFGGIAQGISWRAEKGLWDPSLAFVMGGALAVTGFAFAWAKRQKAPWADTRFYLPTRKDIDAKLVTGGALFGVGWGLAGYCPGPGLASVLTGGLDSLGFVAAMLVGMMIARKIAA